MHPSLFFLVKNSKVILDYFGTLLISRNVFVFWLHCGFCLSNKNLDSRVQIYFNEVPDFSRAFAHITVLEAGIIYDERKFGCAFHF